MDHDDLIDEYIAANNGRERAWRDLRDAQESLEKAKMTIRPADDRYFVAEKKLRECAKRYPDIWLAINRRRKEMGNGHKQ